MYHSHLRPIASDIEHELTHNKYILCAKWSEQTIGEPAFKDKFLLGNMNKI